jgi:RimK-like ATP-grasp domain
MTRMKRPVLIAAASFDEHAYGPVSTLLEKSGYPVIVYKTDKLLAAEDEFTLDLAGDRPALTYNGTSILPDDISAAWYRKIASFTLADADTQLAKQLYMNNEVRALHDTIWPVFYPDDIWLSSPSRLARADRKLGQLLLAREIGFNVPGTLVSSDWESITAALLDSENTQIIVKMTRGVISDNNQIKVLHTTRLDRQRVTGMKSHISPFPGLYQPYIQKAREWRVTVVGNDVFAAAIYTDESAKDDWRKHQNSGGVRFETGKLPDEIADLCILYLRRVSLGFGAFDLVEQPDGEMVFLECNPNGQYGWLEEDLGLPVSASIANALIKVAEARR